MASSRFVFLFLFSQSFIGEKILSNKVKGAEQTNPEETFEKLPLIMSERVDDLSLVFSANIEDLDELASFGNANIVNIAQITLDMQLSALRLAAIKGILDQFTTFVKQLGQYYDDSCYDIIKNQVAKELKRFFKLDTEVASARKVFREKRSNFLNELQPSYALCAKDIHIIKHFFEVCNEKGVLKNLKSHDIQNENDIIVNMVDVIFQLGEISDYHPEDSPLISSADILDNYTPCMQEIPIYITATAQLLFAYRDLTEIIAKLESVKSIARSLILLPYCTFFILISFCLFKKLRDNAKHGVKYEKERNKKNRKANNKDKKLKEVNNNIDHKEVNIKNRKGMNEAHDSNIRRFLNLVAKVLDMSNFHNKIRDLQFKNDKMVVSEGTFFKQPTPKVLKAITSKNVDSEMKPTEFVEAILQHEEADMSPDSSDKNEIFLDYKSLCWRCSKTGVQLFKCGGCLKARYCSKECIDEDWGEHGSYCVKVQNKKKTIASNKLK